jgi:hypothetical protein
MIHVTYEVGEVWVRRGESGCAATTREPGGPSSLASKKPFQRPDCVARVACKRGLQLE